MRSYFLFVPLCLVLFGFGCTKDITRELTEKAINTKLGGDGSVDLSDNQLEVTGNNGETATYGKDVKIPADFPKDIPIYANGTIVATVHTEQGSSYTFTTKDSVDDVLAWFGGELSSGWTKGPEAHVTGGATYFFENDEATMSMFAYEADGQTSAIISRGTK